MLLPRCSSATFRSITLNNDTIQHIQKSKSIQKNKYQIENPAERVTSMVHTFTSVQSSNVITRNNVSIEDLQYHPNKNHLLSNRGGANSRKKI